MRLGHSGKLITLACLAALCLPGRPAFSQNNSQTGASALVSAGAAPASQAQNNPRLAWEDWFFGQRRYGLGYIPDNVLPKAVAQRNAILTRKNGFGRQDADPGAAISAQWLGLGPTVVNSPTRGLISGRITSLAIDPTPPSPVYVATAGGGV